jgi:hypothetical protein
MEQRYADSASSRVKSMQVKGDARNDWIPRLTQCVVRLQFEPDILPSNSTSVEDTLTTACSADRCSTHPATRRLCSTVRAST